MSQTEQSDYKKRFKEEYFQLLDRVEKLNNALKKHKEGTLEFEFACPVEMLERQLEHMSGYLQVLEERSFEEGINLFAIDLEKREVVEIR